MDYLKDVIESIKPILKNYGFKKHLLSWFNENEQIIKIFSIQKSNYGKQIYLNLGIVIKQLENELKYTYYESHIQHRLDHLVGKEILDFENKIDIKKRSEVFKDLISSNPYSFFTLSGTINELNDFISETKTLVVVKKAKDFLNLE